MFDYVRCAYPLPVAGANDLQYQTKSMGCSSMDSYEIRVDGTLWVENYDTEDHSDPTAKGLMRLRGMATRVNKRWKRVDDFTGEIRFYEFAEPLGWIEWSTYFLDGTLQAVNLVKLEQPKPLAAIDPVVGESTS